MGVPEVRYTRSGDVHIAYQVVGEGPLDVVFVPGVLSHLELLWDEGTLSQRFFDRLASFSRLILFDKRSTGLSDRQVGSATLEERMDDVRAVMDAAGSERAALIGYSEGGSMSALFAATYPGRVSALVLASATARMLSAPDYPCGESTGAAIDRLIRMAAEDWGKGRTLEIFAPDLAHSKAARANLAHFERLSTSPGTVRAYIEICKNIDVRSVLPSVRVPTLVVHRSEDPILEVFHARYLAEHIAGARLLVVPGGNHILWVDADQVVDEIEEFLTGTRGGTDLDRVLTTVLFTDIVGSTERAGAVGDRRWRDLLDHHDELSRKELESFRGRLVKTTGDGLLATFDGPARAVRCACALRDAVADLGVELRAGVHTGEVELRGDDVGGIAVHIGQRIASLAGPGQVLVSGTVHDLVFGSGIGFEDRGAQTLRGVPGQWRVFAAV
ncbi:MAG TPA: adenylate/guanylate cyclase domain-containing protein [Acidimicrobiia bacterium]